MDAFVGFTGWHNTMVTLQYILKSKYAQLRYQMYKEKVLYNINCTYNLTLYNTQSTPIYLLFNSLERGKKLFLLPESINLFVFDFHFFWVGETFFFVVCSGSGSSFKSFRQQLFPFSYKVWFLAQCVNMGRTMFYKLVS